MKKFINPIPPIWKILLLYFAFAEVLAFLLLGKVKFFDSEIIFTRFLFLGILMTLVFLKNKLPKKYFDFLTFFSIYVPLGLLYKETYLYNHTLPKIDDWLVEIDHKFFGFQPSLEFSQQFSSVSFSELFFFGYFCYYLLPVAVLFFVFRFNPQKIESFSFIVLCSFLLYYLIFIAIPAMGPQYYFPHPQNLMLSQGFFGDAVQWIQKIGEKPTAAFPSSHVGIGIIILIWLFNHFKKIWLFFLPFVVLLLCSTVYIKAHYGIDVIAGLISAPLVYGISSRIFTFLNREMHVDHH